MHWAFYKIKIRKKLENIVKHEIISDISSKLYRSGNKPILHIIKKQQRRPKGLKKKYKTFFENKIIPFLADKVIAFVVLSICCKTKIIYLY